MKYSGTTWMGVFDLVQGLISIWNQNFLSAEEFLTQACLLASPKSCFQLCHGVTSMELARKWSDSQFLSLAVRSLPKAQGTSVIPYLFAQHCWLKLKEVLVLKKNGRITCVLNEMRPAERFFQMHLLARQSEASSDSSTEKGS